MVNTPLPFLQQHSPSTTTAPGRFRREKKTVKNIQKIFREESDKYSMVLLPMVTGSKGNLLRTSWQKARSFRKLMAKCNGQYHVFNNKLEDRSQVTELLNKIRNITEKNGGSHYTTEMFQRAEKAIEEEKERILKERRGNVQREGGTGEEKKKRKPIEDFLAESEELQELMAKCNGQYHVFNNKLEDRSQVTELLNKIRNITEKNGGSHYTTEMFQRAEKAIEEEKERILKEKEEEMCKEREEQEKKIKKKYEEELKKAKDDMKRQNELKAQRKREMEEKRREMKEMQEIKAREEVRDSTAPAPTAPGRFTEEKKTVKNIQKIFREESDKYSMVLFTHGDWLKGKPIEDFLAESEELQELMAKCNGQYHVFNNKLEDRSQVTELLNKIRNITEKNGGSHYTTEMFQRAEKAIEEEKERILKRKKEEEMCKEREEQEKKIKKKYEEELKKAKDDMKRQNELKAQRKREMEEKRREMKEMQEIKAREEAERSQIAYKEIIFFHCSIQ
ncbi:hypothetical protein D5F01_LYC10106 [Larimichthys crocea]|uniref:AIG1-type G domain-containing protein n=1 Tax=Larimichthys crocea TaxID=215358 RepID=A0A6G0IG89_LARCR|nr:hypothetical protein D5F01_LYC10106 [Larimichthys crocea]